MGDLIGGRTNGGGGQIRGRTNGGERRIRGGGANEWGRVGRTFSHAGPTVPVPALMVLYDATYDGQKATTSHGYRQGCGSALIFCRSGSGNFSQCGSPYYWMVSYLEHQFQVEIPPLTHIVNIVAVHLLNTKHRNLTGHNTHCTWNRWNYSFFNGYR